MKTPILASLAILLAAARIAAAPFAFAATNFPPDLLVGLRKTGGASELVVNLGSVSRFYGASAGAVIPVTGYTSTQFRHAFGVSDDVSLAGFAAVRVEGDSEHPFQTIWVTRRRFNIAEQSVPWRRQGAGTLGTTASRIASIGTGVATYAGSTQPGEDNRDTAVVIPSASANGYTTYIGAGNFKGTFQGNAENVAPSGFSSATDPIRSDLYEIVPGSGDSKYLGYFELTPAGAINFHAPGGLPPPLTAPKITNIARVGNTTTLTILVEAGGRYQLLQAPNGGLRAPVTGWTPVGSSVTATGTTVSLAADSAVEAGFYAVTGSR